MMEHANEINERTGVYDSSMNIMDNNVFEKVGQQVNDSQDVAARNLLSELESA